MKKWMSVLLLAALLLPVCCLAEETVYHLPVDFSGGPKANPACYDTENFTYEDESLSVRMETRDIDRVRYNLAWIKVKSPTQLRTSVAGEPNEVKAKLPSRMGKAVNAVVAINGDFYTQRKDGLIYRQGVAFRYDLNPEKDVLVIDEMGDFHIFVGTKAEELVAFLKEGHQIINAFTFGPGIVKDGEILPLPQTYVTRFDNTVRSPRMAVAQMGPLEYVFVEAQGRNDESIGVTSDQMAAFMHSLGVQQAYLVDGGNSCVMLFGGRYYDSNYKESEREQSDIIYVVSAIPEDTWQ